MSDKTLLNEGTIRRFMKLAELEPLASPFIERIDEDVELALEQEDEGEEEEVMPDLDMGGAEGEDMEMDLGGEEDLDMEEPEGLDMEEPDMDMGGEEDPMETLADEIKQVVVDKLEDMMEDGTLEFMQGEEEEEELDLEDDEGDLELDGAGDEGLEDDELEGEEAGLDVEDEEEPLDDMALEEEETQIVAEVARRVTKRILSSK